MAALAEHKFMDQCFKYNVFLADSHVCIHEPSKYLYLNILPFKGKMCTIILNSCTPPVINLLSLHTSNRPSSLQLASLQVRVRMTFPLKHKSDYVVALFETLQTFPVSLDSLDFGSRRPLKFGHSSQNCCIALHSVSQFRL